MNFEDRSKQHATETGKADPSAFEAWFAAERLEREACAQMLVMKNDQIRLLAGEMTSEEMRTVQAILSYLARAIRARDGKS